MTIAIDCSNISSDGAVAIQNSLLEEIIKENKKSKLVYIFCNNEFTPTCLRESVKIIRVNHSNRAYHLFWQTFILAGKLRKIKCDELYLLGGYYLGNFKSINTVIQNLLPSERSIISTYPLIIKCKLIILNYFYNYTINKSKHLYLLTHHSLKHLPNSLISKTSPEYLNFTIRVSINSKDHYQRSHNGKRFLYVANIIYYKNHIKLVQAFSQIFKKDSSASLTLIGRIVNKQSNNILNKLFRIENASKFLTYDGYIPKDKIEYYYTSHHCLIYPSLIESLGVPLYEAMLFDLPILCSNRISLVPVRKMADADNFRIGHFGYDKGVQNETLVYKNVNYFNPYDEDSIAKSIEFFLS